MTQKDLNKLLPGIVRLVTAIISKEMNMTKEDALREFCDSQTYARLEKEETKFWHLGPVCLYQCYEEEKTTGTITLSCFP